jgi:hypothetical protein
MKSCNITSWSLIITRSLGVIKPQPRFKVCNISYLRVLFHIYQLLYTFWYINHQKNAFILQVKIIPKWPLKGLIFGLLNCSLLYMLYGYDYSILFWSCYKYLDIFEIINIYIYFNVFLKWQWICSFLSSCVLSSNTDKTNILPDYTMTWWVSYKNQELLTLRDNLGSPPMLWVGRCCSSFLGFCVVSLWFVCLRSVSCVLNIAWFFGLSILDSLLGFLYRLL